jgi:hypothetical protein
MAGRQRSESKSHGSIAQRNVLGGERSNESHPHNSLLIHDFYLP